VSIFCPDGYVPTVEAIGRAAQHWFAEQFAVLETAAASQQGTEPDGHIEQAVRAFSQPQVPEVWRHIAKDTVHRLRNFLHQGKLSAYYFENDGRHVVPRDFWATTHANGVLESGIYWPFGEPSRFYEQRPNSALFVLQSDLHGLLSVEPAKKRPLPRSRIPDLVAALSQMVDLPNRRAQYEALCTLPEFREFKITHADFREATKQSRRDPGRKPRRNS
jgi:hypothetical protein